MDEDQREFAEFYAAAWDDCLRIVTLSVGNRALGREFSFDDFNGAFGFVARVARLAEAESHHPAIELEWGRAAFRTWTHTASGLSRNDFILAAKIDLLAGSP